MYRIALCDDNDEILDLLQETLQSYSYRHQFDIDLKRFTDSDTLMELIEERKLFDAYFLDIDMPVHSGLDLVKTIRTLTSLPVIILLTGYEQYAVEACGMDIFRYVLKSRWNKESESLMEELFVRLSNIRGNRFYLISNQRKHVMFRVDEIISIYKNRKNVVFVLQGRGDETERQSLFHVYEKLKCPELFLLDRCSIVNIRHIQRIWQDAVIMAGGTSVLSSAENIRRLKDYLSSYWRDYL